MEKSFVNTDITAPSATMALAMIFLKYCMFFSVAIGSNSAQI